MKNVYKVLLCLSVFCAYISTSAQTPPVREPDMNRANLFQGLPEKISCRINDLTSLLESQTGQNISIPFFNSLNFQGTITSMATLYDSKLQSVVIRSTNFPGAALSFSKIIKEDGSINYTGRIISFQHGDAYEIRQENGEYFFIKKGFYDLVNE